MSKKKRKKIKREAQQVAFVHDCMDWIPCAGYTRLDKNPEIVTACRTIADLISGMTIYLMSNTEKGDQRIINELSRKVDIEPNRYMTRKTWMDAIVMNLLLHGSGNSVVRITTDGEVLGDLIPVSPALVSFMPEGHGYYLTINGVRYEPEDVLHFVLNPDPDYLWMGQGLTTSIRDVAENLKQAAATKKGFMESKWKPSVIVKVDSMVDEFSSPDGRRKLLQEYIETSEAGEPWMIPAEQFSVEQIKPLSLSDLALNDAVELDKKTVAAIIGVPAFVLGVGEFNAEEWNNFISNKIGPLAKEIAQELTKKLLLSPKWYWKFNVSSLYAFDLKTIAEVYGELRAKGIVDGNEVRDKLSLSPREGLDELVMLENYIPTDRAGDQKKLQQEE